MKSLEQVLKDYLDYARSVKPDANWAPHSPLSDLVIAVPAKETWKLWTVAEYVRLIQTFKGFQFLLQNSSFLSDLQTSLGITGPELEALITNDLNNLATDWGFTRKGAQKAYGVVRVYFAEHGNYTIPAGTLFQTSSGVLFESLHSVINWSTQTLDGRPAIDIAVACTTPGTVGNVGPRRITTVLGTIEGSTGITNPNATLGGADEETNIDFVNRIVEWLSSTSTGSINWLKNLVFSQSYVRQVEVITCREDNREKFARGYGADIWVVVDEDPVLTTEQIQENEANHYCLQQPVIERLTIPILPVGMSFTRHYPVNYLTNERNVWAMSIFGSDMITRSTTGVITVSYYYDRNIEALQTLVSRDDYWFLGGESVVVIRKAVGRAVDITAEIWLSSGYSQSDIEPVILDNLAVFFAGGTTAEGRTYSALRLGKPVDHSDILEVILETEGVDRVNLDTFKVELESTAYDNSSANDPLILRFFEYPILGTVNLTFH